MKKEVAWIIITSLIATLLVLPSCAKPTSTTTSSPTSKTTSTSTSPLTTTSTTNPSTQTTQTTITNTGNWWDKFGIPQYGGEMTLRFYSNILSFDPYNTNTLATIEEGWLERMNADNWLIDPAIFAFNTTFRPNEYTKGWLAESWEFPSPDTYLVHLRKGIHWQDISPANGREFTADDVAFHYSRACGLGYGYTKPSPWVLGQPIWASMKSVTVIDKYTISFKWTIANPEYIMETMQGLNNMQDIECPDVVKLYGDCNDWHHAIGTGAFILQDFVSDSSATLVKNPNYWGYDEHYPQNKLPYVDKINFLIIPDYATALSALRTGKIDFIDNVPLAQAQAIQKSHPEILQLGVPLSSTITVDPRNDVKPFNDIRVRKAMQLAIDLPTIAKEYYQGYVDSVEPSSLTGKDLTGWGFPYAEWPQDLKDEYSYNPTAAKKLLADAGYPNGFNTDVVANNTGDLDLLQIVKSYLAAIGINMDIRTMDAASWSSFVQVGHKHDALAQRGLAGLLGQCSEPTIHITYFTPGMSINYSMINDPVFNTFSPKLVAAASVTEAKQIMKDANKYVAQQHFAISLLKPVQIALYQPWFKGYDGRSYEISAANGGPRMLGYYGARLWIDQNLKKSLED